MRLTAILLTASLLSSCALLKAPGRTIKSVGRTFGLDAPSTSFQIDSTATEAPGE